MSWLHIQSIEEALVFCSLVAGTRVYRNSSGSRCPDECLFYHILLSPKLFFYSDTLLCLYPPKFQPYIELPKQGSSISPFVPLCEGRKFTNLTVAIVDFLSRSMRNRVCRSIKLSTNAHIIIHFLIKSYKYVCVMCYQWHRLQYILDKVNCSYFTNGAS